jgi:hypothetical protein
MTSSTGLSQSTRDHAALALNFAVMALRDAEESTCDAEELAGLCDEVIRRRLRLRLSEIDEGRVLPTATLAQMNRDRTLLAELAEYRGQVPERPNTG